MQINIHSKELQAAIDRVLPVINKKSYNPAFTRVYLQPTADANLKIWATDSCQYAEVIVRNCHISGDESFGIDIDAYKFIKKLNGLLLFKLAEDKKSDAQIHCEKKTIKVHTYSVITPPVPRFADSIKPLAALSEAWLLETITKCEKFIAHNGDSYWDGINFNIVKQRAEAADGYCCAIRSMPPKSVKAGEDCDSVLLPDISIPALKKILNKKSDDILSICQHEDYIKVAGENFAYIVRRLKNRDNYVSYPDLDRLLAKHYDTGFKLQKSDMVEVLKYDCDIIKGCDKGMMSPLVLRVDKDRLGVYITSIRLEAFDEVDIQNCTCETGFVIACNPNMFYKACELIDKPEFDCKVDRAVDPIILCGDEYKCWVFPVRITDGTSSCVDKLKQYMHAA